MAKIKSCDIPLSLPSTLPDITCKDGEVANFSNIPWLQDLLDNQNATTGNSSGGTTTHQPLTKPECRLEESGITLPAGATLIGIHSLAISREVTANQENNLSQYYFFLTRTGTLGYLSVNKNIVSYIPNFSLSSQGEIHGFHPRDNLIILLTATGLHYLLYHHDTDTWDYAEQLPDPPSISLTSTPAHLPGWTYVAGNYPIAIASIPLANPDEISDGLIADYFSGLNPAAISEVNAKKISNAVIDAACRFIEESAKEGKYLLPPKVITAYAESIPGSQPFFCLPSAIASIETENTDFPVSIDDYEWWNGTLTIRIMFEILPLDIAATITPPADISCWREIFPTLNIFTKESRFQIQSSPRIIYPSGRKYSLAGVVSVKRDSEYRLSKSTDTKSVTKWITMLDTQAATEISTIYTPDYKDHSRFIPTGIVEIGGKCHIYGGTAKIPDEKGVFHNQQTAKYIFETIDPAGVIFRNKAQVSGQIRAISPMTSTLFSEKGIEKLSVSSGKFSFTRILGDMTPLNTNVISTDSGTVYLSHRGLQFISVSSKISTLADWQTILRTIKPDIGSVPSSLIPHIARCLQPCYDYPSDMILLLIPETIVEILNNISGNNISDTSINTAPSGGASQRILIIDPVTGRICYDPLTLPAVTTPHNGHMHSVSTSGVVSILSVKKISTATSEHYVQPISTVEVSGQENQNSAGSTWCVTTRPLKFGAPFIPKRLISIVADTTAIMDLEGSDNLTDWHPVLCVTLPATRLHLPSYRFFRITLRSANPTPYTPHLLSINYII